MSDDTHRIEGVKAIRDTRKPGEPSGGALLIVIEGEEVWVPHSVIHDDSEVYDARDNSEGDLVVHLWFAEKEGLVD